MKIGILGAAILIGVMGIVTNAAAVLKNSSGSENNASVEKLNVTQASLFAYACESNQPPEYCSWQKEKLMVREQNIVDDAIANIGRVILPYLNHATWVSYDKMNPAIQKIQSYCDSKLTALREGRVKYFPQPQAKSSEIGSYPIKQRENEIANRVDCQKKTSNRVFIAQIALQKSLYFNSYTSWLYEQPQGYAQLYLNPTNGDLILNLVTDSCKGSRRFRHEEVSEDMKLMRQGSGFFTEQAFGLVDIEGELFAIEGGVMNMDHNSERWKSDDYAPLVYATEPEQTIDTWRARILALHPLAGARGKQDVSGYDKPCLWNIGD